MQEKASSPPALLLMAEIIGAHGLRGGLKLKIFGGEAEALLDYPPLLDVKSGKTYRLTGIWQHGTIYLAECEGIDDRDDAEKLKGVKLYLSRDALPEIKEEATYYHADLIGLAALKPDGAALGKVVAVANFGAGDLLEIKPATGNSFYVPFTDAVVPEVDIKGGKVTVDPPPGLLD